MYVKRKGYTKQEAKRYRLTKKEFQYLDSSETDKETERQLNELIDDIRQFLSECHELSLSPEQVHDSLLLPLQKNIDTFTELFSTLR